MKLFSLLAILAVAAFSAPKAHAIPNAGVSARILASQTTISSTAYVELVHSLSKAVKGVMVYHTGPNPVKLAIGVSGSEQDQLIIPQGTLPGGAYAGAPVGSYSAGQGQFIPIAMSQGTRVSLKALNSDEAVGEIYGNFLFY